MQYIIAISASITDKVTRKCVTTQIQTEVIFDNLYIQ